MAAESAFQHHFARLTTELFECDTCPNSLSDQGGRNFGQPGLKALAKCSEVEASPQAVMEELLSLNDGARPRIHIASLEAAVDSKSLAGPLGEAGVQDAAVLIDLGLHSARQAATLGAILELARHRLHLAAEPRGDRGASSGGGGGESSSTSPGEAPSGRCEPLRALFRFLDGALDAARHCGGAGGGGAGENAFVDVNLSFPSSDEARDRAHAMVAAVAAAMQKFRATHDADARPEEEAAAAAAVTDKGLEQHRAKALIDETAAARSFKKLDSLIRRSTGTEANSLLRILSV